MEKAIVQFNKGECYQLLDYLEFAKKNDFLKTKGQYKKRHDKIRQGILHSMLYAGIITFEEYKNEGGKYIKLKKYENTFAF